MCFFFNAVFFAIVSGVYACYGGLKWKKEMEFLQRVSEMKDDQDHTNYHSQQSNLTRNHSQQYLASGDDSHGVVPASRLVVILGGQGRNNNASATSADLGQLFHSGTATGNQFSQTSHLQQISDRATATNYDGNSREQLHLPPVSHPCYQQTILPIYDCQSEWIEPNLSNQGRLFSNAMSYCSVRETERAASSSHIESVMLNRRGSR